jgi:hypothetical protein
VPGGVAFGEVFGRLERGSKAASPSSRACQTVCVSA